MAEKGKGSALLLLAGKLGGKGGESPKPPNSEPDLSKGGKEVEQSAAGDELAAALKVGGKPLYDAVCAILDMHKEYSGEESDEEDVSNYSR